MKRAHIIIGLVIGIMIGTLGGWFLARERARAAIIGGPDSDNYPPALAAIAEARARLLAGDANVLKHLSEAEAQIRQAQQWTRKFLGQQDSATSGSQPIRTETNRTSPAAGSRR